VFARRCALACSRTTFHLLRNVSRHHRRSNFDRRVLFEISAHENSPLLADRVSRLEGEGAYAVLARAQKLEAQGRDIIHLEIGQPDFSTPWHIVQAGIDAIIAGKTKYNPPAGITELRKAIAEDAGRRRNISISPESVVIGPGAKPGLFFPLLAILQPGEGNEVIYPDPSFPTYPAAIEAAQGVPVPVALDESKNFSFDLAAFDEKVSDRTRLIILNSPSNPTGGIMPLEALQHIAQAAIKHNAWVLSDEIYSRLVYDDSYETAPSIASLPGMSDRTIIVDGFSKTFSMTGWRLGYTIAPPKLAQRLELLLTHSVGCTATFVQHAGLAAVLGDQLFVKEVVQDLKERRDLVVNGLNSIPGIQCQKPQGAFYVFPNISSFNIKSSVLAQQILDEAGVALLSGTDFGPGGEGYLRISYATSKSKLEEGIYRLKSFFSSLPQVATDKLTVH